MYPESGYTALELDYKRAGYLVQDIETVAADRTCVNSLEQPQETDEPLWTNQVSSKIGWKYDKEGLYGFDNWIIREPVQVLIIGEPVRVYWSPLSATSKLPGYQGLLCNQ